MQCKENWNLRLLVIDQRCWKVINYDEVLIIISSMLLNLEIYSAKSRTFLKIFKNDLVVIFLRWLIGIIINVDYFVDRNITIYLTYLVGPHYKGPKLTSAHSVLALIGVILQMLMVKLS